jgi:hexosaminidase
MRRWPCKSAGWLVGLCLWATGDVAAGADPRPYSLSWGVLSWDRTAAEETTLATLHLGVGERGLPASGWSLYFNCASELRLGERPDHLAVENLGGSFYRIRPLKGFTAVAAGAALDLTLEHQGIVARQTRAPNGPYLVFDDEPDRAIAITDYELKASPPQSGALVPGSAEENEQRFRWNQSVAVLREDEYPPVLPTPKTYRRLGTFVRTDRVPRLVGPATVAREMAAIQDLFRRRITPRPQEITPDLEVRVAVDPALAERSREAYSLEVRDHRILVRGKTAAGVAHAVASLEQLVRTDPTTGQAVVPALRIEDAPRYAYRGLHFDAARNFQTKEVVFHLIDLMARHKLNVFHLHLTDDEGWRLEIPELPELTEVGARRGHSTDPHAMLPPAHGSGPEATDPHGSGFYRAEDYIAILRYAAARHIEVIPEIEMPGHARAAVKAMEARYARLSATDPAAAREYLLSDFDDRSAYVSAQGFTDNVMNPGLESTYKFIDQVLMRVAQLHRDAGVPLKTIHVGGDELPDGAWSASPKVDQLLVRAHLTNRQMVWNVFYERIFKLVERHGAHVAGWEELGSRRSPGGRSLEPNPAFARRGIRPYVWNDFEGAEDLGPRLANAGYDIVLSPASAYYFDIAYFLDEEAPGATWAQPSGLHDAFAFEPEDYALRLPGDLTHRMRLSSAGARRIQGLEGCLWTETMRDPALLDYMLLPRMLGLAERAWASRPAWTRVVTQDKTAYARAWSVFMNQVGRIALPALDLDRAAAYRVPPPGLRVAGDRVEVNLEVPGFLLRYRLDGVEPDEQSPLVQGSLPRTAGLRVAAFDRNGRHGKVISLR